MQKPLFVQHLSSKSEIVFHHQPYPGQDVRKDLFTGDSPRSEVPLRNHFTVENFVFNLAPTDFGIPRVHEENLREDAHQLNELLAF